MRVESLSGVEVEVEKEALTTLEKLKAGSLIGIKRLDLSCGLTAFPNEIFNLADSLEILNLSGNALTNLPNDLPRLYKLRIIFCSDNKFTELPRVLGRCKSLTMVGFKANQIRVVPEEAISPALRWLILTDNQIQELPKSIGHCRHMQKLMLAGNLLSDLPDELAHCKKIELLRLSANKFSTLPTWLLSMPKLAWLALAGNPLTDNFEKARDVMSIPEIDWTNIELGSQLGEGASGVIFRARLEQADSSIRDVAVKVFKSALTSDGLPQSEISASLAVGLHENIVGVVGKIRNHSMGAESLMMPLISTDFKSLAQPPSLDSCSRDVYAKDTIFNFVQLCRIALDIALAAKHMHDNGIMHGDLYAHNIMYNAGGDAKLGDFGAASFLPARDTALSLGLQRIEVLAFGIFLEELLSRCRGSSNKTEQVIKQKLDALKTLCMLTDVSRRPLFKEVVGELTLIQSNLTYIDPDSRLS